jgi:hypothetical protein
MPPDHKSENLPVLYSALNGARDASPVPRQQSRKRTTTRPILPTTP